MQRKFWEKTLAWILAVVCCLGIINFAPLAQKANAADGTVYVYDPDNVYTGIWTWNASYGQTSARSKGGQNGAWYDWGTDGWFNLEFSGWISGDYESGGDKFFGYKSGEFYQGSSKADVEAHFNPVSQITVTLVDGTDSHWLSGANDGVTAYFTANGVNMTQVDGTHWTATINAADTVTFGRGPSYADQGWNTWIASSRGDATTYTATGNGTGTWGASTPAEFKSAIDFNNTVGAVNIYVIENYSGSFSTTSTASDVTSAGGRFMTWTGSDGYNHWTDPTTATTGLTFVAVRQSDGVVQYQWLNESLDSNHVFDGTIANSDPLTVPAGDPGSVYGTPNTAGISYQEPTVVIDEMEDQNNGKNTLITVPAVMYNYLPGGGDGWWNQFKNFDRDIMTYYAGDGKMGHPLVIGAFAAREDWGSTGTPYEGALFGFLDHIKGSSSYGFDNKTWFYNHNIESDGYWNNTGKNSHAPIQGMVNEYLSTEGDLLSSENNVVIPFFDDNFLTGRAQKFGSASQPIAFPFRDEGNGYYIFDSRSGEDNVYMGSDGKLVYDSSEGARIHNFTNGDSAFFPFNTRGAATTYAKSIGYSSTTDDTTNYGFGARMHIPFTIPAADGAATGDAPLASNSAASFSNNGNEGWVTTTLDTTLQEGDYTLAITYGGGGGFMWTHYGAVGSPDQATGDYEGYQSNGSVGSWGTADFGNYGREVQNINGTLLLPLHVTTATNQIHFYGKTWSTSSMNIGVYNNGANIQPSSGSNDIVFRFSGDDDLWVFVDGRLALDMGGAHARAEGEINFTNGTVTIDYPAYMNGDTIEGGNVADVVDTSKQSWLTLEENSKHVLTVFYMERGLYDSNLKIEFNFVPIKLSASDAFFAEMGTPVEIPLDAEFVGQSYDYAAALANSNFSIKYNGTTYSNVNDFRSAFGGTFTFDNAGKLTYKSNPQTEAFKDEFVIIFNDGSNSEYELEVNNYKGNDDVYVIDYGIPVELRSYDEYDLFANDKFSLGEAEKVWESALSTAPNNNSQIASKYTATAAGLTVAETVTGNNGYGKAKVTDKANNRYAHYIYALDKFLDTTDTFYYASQVVRAGTEDGATLDSSNATPIMTSKVTILPANVVYYEDNFSYYNDTSARAITYSANAPQVVDSTGIVKQSNNWDDLYGYDTAYENQYADSLGHAAALGNSTQVQFTFKGTGFDIISRTDATSAAVLYGVYNASGAAVKFGMLDTKYTNGTLYQLPVISVTDLAYGQYTVKLQVMSTNSGSTFYFDGIRVYNPMSLFDRTGWSPSASNSNGNAYKALDNDITTRWDTTAYQEPGQTFIVDMKEAKTFDTVVMLLGDSTRDYPAAYNIYVSSDGSNWGTPVKTGTNENTERYYVGPQTARYIKVEQTGNKNLYWSIHEFYVTYRAYVDNEESVKFQSVRQMVLGDCTMSETSFINASGNVVTSTVIPGSTATISGSQITEDNGNGATGTHGVSSVVESLQSAPNSEVYLGSGSSLSFNVTPVAGVADANRTLQIEAKLVKTAGTTTPENATFTINGTPVSIKSSTAMYYNIAVPANGNVVIGGVTAEGCNLSLTNIKYAGYTLVENSADSISSEQPYITAISINGGAPVEYGNVNANDKVNVTLTFSKEVTVSTGNLKLSVNGNSAVYYFANMSSQSSNTQVTGTEVTVQISAPKAAGSYTYKFDYTANGKTVSKTVNLNVAAKSTRR